MTKMNTKQKTIKIHPEDRSPASVNYNLWVQDSLTVLGTNLNENDCNNLKLKWKYANTSSLILVDYAKNYARNVLQFVSSMFLTLDIQNGSSSFYMTHCDSLMFIFGSKVNWYWHYYVNIDKGIIVTGYFDEWTNISSKKCKYSRHTSY